MRSCPRCGSEIGDNDTFCEKCGAYAGEGSQSVPQKTGKGSSFLPILLIVLSVSMLIVIMSPYFFQEHEYTYTLTVEEVGIICDDDTDSLIYKEGGKVPVHLEIKSGEETIKTSEWALEVNGDNYIPASGNVFTFKTTSEDPNFTIWALYRTGPEGSECFDDELDLFDAVPMIVEGPVPEILGVTGVTISYTTLLEECELKGDTYPMGYLKLKITRS
jgi:hypothetical protein